jgi:hypothetical protein
VFIEVWSRFKIKTQGKSKVKFPASFLTDHNAMKAYWGSGGIAPRILTSALDGGE